MTIETKPLETSGKGDDPAFHNDLDGNARGKTYIDDVICYGTKKNISTELDKLTPDGSEVLEVRSNFFPYSFYSFSM